MKALDINDLIKIIKDEVNIVEIPYSGDSDGNNSDHELDDKSIEKAVKKILDHIIKNSK